MLATHLLASTLAAVVFLSSGTSRYRLMNHDSINVRANSSFAAFGANEICLDEQNAERKVNGKQPFEWSTELATVAEEHSKLMANFQELCHSCPGEDGLGERITKSGYSWRNYSENVAHVTTSDCQQTVTQWMDSPSHRKNLLGDYQHVGCSTTDGYWTCNFANPQ